MEAIILKSGREKSVLQFHPWLYSGGVKVFPKAKLGEIVRVHDNKNTFLGYGFYDANSQIVAKLFHFEEQKNDSFDPKFWKDKVLNAFQLRKSLVDFTYTNTYRLLHAEGDLIPGLVADVYDHTVVFQVSNKGIENILEHIVSQLKELGFKYFYKKVKNYTQVHDDETLEKGCWIGDKPSVYPILVKENNVKFLIDVEKGQKTGFFLDQRDNRQWLAQYSKGKTVLNTFSYSGGFSAYALVAGAAKVVSVDISKDAIELANQNIRLNLNADKHQTIVADCFDFMKNHKDKYDVVVVDPPAFAKAAKSVPNASRGYKELNMSALRLVKSGGLLMTFSCSQNIDRSLFQKIIFSAAADLKLKVRIIKHLEQPLDHPVNIYHPEGEYLKGLLLYVE